MLLSDCRVILYILTLTSLFYTVVKPLYHNRLSRMTSGLNRVHSFGINFMRLLYSTKPIHYSKMNDIAHVDVFESDILLIPFEAGGHKSLFVVVGAKHIRKYQQNLFQGTRPCIIHFDSLTSRCSPHKAHNVAQRLRVWLNVLWRSSNNMGDQFIAPFNKRSLPMIQPRGKYTPSTYLLTDSL